MKFRIYLALFLFYEISFHLVIGKGVERSNCTKVINFMNGDYKDDSCCSNNKNIECDNNGNIIFFGV